MQAAFTTQLYIYIRTVVSWSGYKNLTKGFVVEIKFICLACAFWKLQLSVFFPIRANVPIWKLKFAHEQWKLQKQHAPGLQIGYHPYRDSGPKWCGLWVPESQCTWQHPLTMKETHAPLHEALVHPSAGLHWVTHLLENLVSVPGLLRVQPHIPVKAPVSISNHSN